MKNISSKKSFFYISAVSLLLYALFVLIVFNTEDLPVLYDVKTCSSYYLFSYIALVAVLYCIDVHTRKEPGFLTLYCLPLFTTVFVFLALLSTGNSYQVFIVLLLSISLLYILGYICDKYWMKKILTIKNGYVNIVFFYIIIHLMVALYITFSIFGYM